MGTYTLFLSKMRLQPALSQTQSESLEKRSWGNNLETSTRGHGWGKMCCIVGQ
jgi:hypothetical protein